MTEQFKEKIGITNFVKRQTKRSAFTHYQGKWNDLKKLTLENFLAGHTKPGYRDGVCLIQVPAENFYTYTDYPMFEGMRLKSEYKPRKPGEEPRLVTRILEPKMPANYVDIVLYRWDVLAEDNDRSTEAEWEIISINGRRENKGDEPIPPLAMARNFLHLKGGTRADYTAEQFAKSIIYWSKRGSND